MPSFKHYSRLTFIAATLCLSSASTFAQNYSVNYLVSDLSSGTTTADTNLINGWGMSRSSGSPWWVSDAGSGKSTLYDGTGKIERLVVTIPPGQPGHPGLPSGTLFNGTGAFQLTPAHSAVFLFVTLDGTISGWNQGVDPANAVIMVNHPGSAYTGATIAFIKGVPYLYVSNFATKQIEVYDGNFNPVNLGPRAWLVTLPPEAFSSFFPFDAPLGSARNVYEFIFSVLGRGFAPYNIYNVGNTLYVAYAQVDPNTGRRAAGAGLGYVLAFEPNGRFIRPLSYGSYFNAPWGMALAPSDFGAFSHCLLVGNFGDGTISAFNVTSGQYLGQLTDTTSKTIAIDGLWTLSFGNGATAGPVNTLYFSAGPNHEMDGAFGSITTTTNPLGNGQ